LSVYTYKSRAQYALAQVLGVCPDSYIFVREQMSVSASRKNWFQIPAETGGAKWKVVELIAPLSPYSGYQMEHVIVGMAITGVSLHDSNFDATSISFNVTFAYDIFGNWMGTAGNLSYSSHMPFSGYVTYFSAGFIGGCSTNFDIYNQTHCFCNPAQNLTFDPSYSYYKCR
jgi:hypothetical protein